MSCVGVAHTAFTACPAVRPALGRTSLGSAGEFGRDLGWARNQTERSRIFL